MTKTLARCLCLQAALLLGMGVVWAQNSNMGQSTAPDNTANNQRDQAAGQPTADQQMNDQTDRQLTQKIRHSLMKDKSLSTDAHNIKVISQNGMVTLEGPVDSDDEKKAVEAKAAMVAGGSDKVTSQIQVKGNQ